MLILPYIKYPGWAGALDRLSTPYGMLAALGTGNQARQETRYWNNRSLSKEEIVPLFHRLDMLAIAQGDYQNTFEERLRRRISAAYPLFHMYMLGGWHRYVVLTCPSHEPDQLCYEWRVGWVNDRFQGVSLLPLKDRHVLCLVGPEPTHFFALRRIERDGTDVLAQVPLVVSAQGTLGDGRHDHIRLL